jgi:hypothetical protein
MDRVRTSGLLDSKLENDRKEYADVQINGRKKRR